MRRWECESVKCKKAAQTMVFTRFFRNFAVMRKGRDRTLINERDRKLFERYYYWTEVRRLRFDDTIQKLSSEEFFLSEQRIIQIIRRMLQEGATVNGEKIPVARFAGFRNLKRPGRRQEKEELSLFT